MDCNISFRRYQRSFVKPLRTAHGKWSVREGFIVRFERGSTFFYGEIAPIPEFGTETIEAAETFLQSLVRDVEFLENTAELDGLPCCAFGISSACSDKPLTQKRDYAVAALLPAGRSAVNIAKAKSEQGYKTFKWKVGVEPIAEEQAIFLELLKQLPSGTRLRLDANGGLSVESLESWLALLQEHRQQIEYLEQPLAVGQESLMADYADSFHVPIALDESLNSTEGKRWLVAGAWQGPLVVKPALMGDRDRLIERLRPVAGKVVLSSVFETAIGLENALHIADQLPELKRAIGFGTLDAFADGLTPLSPGPVIAAADRGRLNFAYIWKALLK